MKSNALLVVALLAIVAGLVALAAWDLYVFAVGLVGACLGLIIAYHRRRQQDRAATKLAWRDFADSNGFAVADPASQEVLPDLWGRWSGVLTSIEPSRVGNDGTEETDITAWFETPLPLAFAVFKETPASRMAARDRGVEDIKLGDPKLDRLLSVKSPDVEAVKALLTAEGIPDRLATTVERYDRVVLLPEGVRLVLHGIVASGEALAARLDDAVALANAFKAAAEASGFPAPEAPGAGTAANLVFALAVCHRPGMALEAREPQAQAFAGREYASRLTPWQPDEEHPFTLPDPAPGTFYRIMTVPLQRQGFLLEVPDRLAEAFEQDANETAVRVKARVKGWNREAGLLHMEALSGTKVEGVHGPGAMVNYADYMDRRYADWW